VLLSPYLIGLFASPFGLFSIFSAAATVNAFFLKEDYYSIRNDLLQDQKLNVLNEPHIYYLLLKLLVPSIIKADKKLRQ